MNRSPYAVCASESANRLKFVALCINLHLHYMCAVWKCVRALLCLVFIIAVHLGNEVIFYQLSPLTLQVTVNSRNATQTI